MRSPQMPAVAFAARLRRQEPAKPNTPSPPAKSGKAAGSGVAVAGSRFVKLTARRDVPVLCIEKVYVESSAVPGDQINHNAG
jgi:hypothetical protein